MIDFTNVSREFNSLVVRRRELLTILGSIFAGMGIFLQNALQGNLPESLKSVQDHLFAFYAMILLATSLIIALRMARLHAGMVINGFLFAKLMQHQNWTHKGDLARAVRHNPFSASFLQFLLVDLIAGFSASVLVLAVGSTGAIAAIVGLSVFSAWLSLYFYFHHHAVRFAIAKAHTEACTPFTRNEWEEHIAGSLENTNQDLLGTLSFSGLMMFSLLETLSGVGQIVRNANLDLAADDILAYGPEVYTVLMFIVCLLELMIYLRLRVALGRFSLERDPTDKPFQPLRLTDSLLGYMLLAFFFTVSLHLAQVTLFPILRSHLGIVLSLDLVGFVIAILSEQITLVKARRAHPIRVEPQEE